MVPNSVSPRPQRSSLRQDHRRLTRSRILEAGREVFAEKGYMATTIDDIVASAGVGRATFYLHFSTKYDVIAQLFRDLRPELIKYYRKLDATLSNGTPDGLQNWMLEALNWMDEHSGIINAADAATLAGEPLRYDRFTFDLADEMTWLMARWPEHRRDELRARVALLANQFRSALAYMLGHRDDRKHANLADLGKVMADIWGPALTPPQPQRRTRGPLDTVPAMSDADARPSID